MGWSFATGQSRDSLVRERTTGDTNNQCLEHCLAGDTLWTVWAVTPSDTTRPAYRFIGCDLLEYSAGDRGWGYKDMSEEMGPFYYDCPLRFLEMVPVANEEWRTKVRAFWAGQPHRAVTNG